MTNNGEFEVHGVQTGSFGEPRSRNIEDFSTGSTHPDCTGDTDLCPDDGCKRCQGPAYDNRIRGRIKR